MDDYINLLGKLLIGALFIFSFWSVRKSIDFLKKEIGAYYEFDLFYPSLNSWTVIVYLLIVGGVLLFSYLLFNIPGFLPHA